jgi:DNA-binding transcriptional ArsR family regulator
MARAATTTDVFNAVAEARRREILDALADGEASVNDLAERLELAQPQVSKHLKVLAEVGLVRVRAEGRQRLYRLDAPALSPIQQWLAKYERMINARYDRLDDYLGQLQADRTDRNDRTDRVEPDPTRSKPDMENPT